MNTVERTVLALALTESGGKWESWGDGGRAMGAWQTHPAWLFERARRFALTPTVGETWHSFQSRVVTAWVDKAINRDGLLPCTAAMKFHRGHLILPGDEDWDGDYALRFMVAYNNTFDPAQGVK